MHAFQTILFCTDFSEHADFAFDFALGLAAQTPGAELHVLHVLPEPAAQFWRGYVREVDDIDDRTRAEIDACFASLQERAGGARCFAGREPCVPRACVRVGKPGEEIVAHAKSCGADLILLGRRVHGSIFSGKTAAHVARHATCPVLVVPLDFKGRRA